MTNQKQKDSSNLDSYLFGKLPPQSVELEQAVIGAILIDSKAIHSVAKMLIKEHFYAQANQEIYGVIIDLYRENKKIDILTVSEKLKGNEWVENPPYFLTDLTNRVGSSSNIEDHARIVVQNGILRDLISMASETIEHCYSGGDPFNISAAIERRMMAAFQSLSRAQTVQLKDAILPTMKRLENTTTGKMTGIPAYFTDIDRVTGGWQPGDLIILGGRPGMGKTAFVLSMMRRQASHGHKVGFISLEMTTHQNVVRLISNTADINMSTLRDGRMTKEDWAKINKAASEKLYDLPMFINDEPGMTLMQLKAEIYRMKKAHGMEFIAIDHIGFIERERGNATLSENDFKGMVSRHIKNMAKDLDMPIMLLSQLNRNVETRKNRKPQLSDLRDSGNIEQDADICAFLYRPFYYHLQGLDGFETYEDGESTASVGEFMIEKHRSGECKTVKLAFQADRTTYHDYDFTKA